MANAATEIDDLKETQITCQKHTEKKLDLWAQPMEGLGNLSDLEDWNSQPTERLWDSPTESVEPRHDQQPPNVRREADSEAVSTTKTSASEERPLPASESEPPLQQTAANLREAGRRFNRNIILA